MCLTRRLRQGCESRALWILTSQFQSESMSGMMPVTDHFDERMVLQCMEYCNGFDTFQYLFDLIDLLQCWKRLLWSLRVWNASRSMTSGLSFWWLHVISHIGQLRLDAVCQKLMTTYACWMSAIWWVWFWWICGTNKMLSSRYFAYCCCLLLRTQNEPETLFSPTSAVVLSFSECWVDPTLHSWVLLNIMCRWMVQGSCFSIQPKSNLNWFEGRVCDPMKDVLRAKH